MRGSLRFLLPVLALVGLPGTAALAAPGFTPAIDAEVQAARDNMMGNQSEAMRHAAAAKALARELVDPRQRAFAVATAYWLEGEAHLRINEVSKAGLLLRDGLRLIEPFRESSKLRGDLLMSQGAFYMARNQAVQALNNYQTAFRTFGAVNELRSQAIALQNIGALYNVANDDERAEQYYRQAAELYDGDPALSFTLHNNRGNVLASLERSAEAVKEYEAALRLARHLDAPLLEARVLINIARAQVDLRHYADAERSLMRGTELVRGTDATLLIRHLAATSARLAAERGDFRRAVHLIGQAFDGLDLATTTVDFRMPHLYAYQIYTRTGDATRALVHLEALKRLSDEAAKVATTTGAALMAARFNYAEQQARIQKLKADEAERAVRSQLILFLSIGAATLVIIALLSIGLMTLRRSRNQVRAANLVLGETNAALEKALKAKTEFLATTSHEIRTPLNGILGMTQVMLSDAQLAPEMRDRIGIVHGAGVTMRSLVDDILDVAKMETGNLTVDAAPMDLCATLREVTRIWEEQSRAKGLLFRLELSHAPQWILSDEGRLRQIVFNLLSNAVKFTAKGAITVRAVAEGDKGDRRLRLSVADSGIGIPPEKFEEIFESFRQVDAGTTRQFGGTGLGLTICRNLARALGGDISVESKAGEGSRFTVELPLIPAEAPELAHASGVAGGMLIVDRNPIARSMLRTLFEPRVAALRFASSVDEALASLAAAPVDHWLADEATLKAGDADPLAALATLVAAAGEARGAVLWLKPASETRAALLATGIGHVFEKPVAGIALVDAFIPPPKEKSTSESADPLVSRAA